MLAKIAALWVWQLFRGKLKCTSDLHLSTYGLNQESNAGSMESSANGLERNREGADPLNKGGLVTKSFVSLYCTVTPGREDSWTYDRVWARWEVNLTSLPYRRLCRLNQQHLAQDLLPHFQTFWIPVFVLLHNYRCVFIPAFSGCGKTMSEMRSAIYN